MNKLSKHVLGMKFMRRTKEQVTTEKTETTFRHHYSKTSSNKAHSKPQTDTKPVLNNGLSLEIELVGSYSQCEGHIFGRQSFGGFNPVVESNVSKGIWRPCYLDDADVMEQDEEGQNSDLDSEIEEGEVDVPDKEMARTFGSLVGTLGKKFLKKRDRDGKKKSSQQSSSSSNHKTTEGHKSQQGNDGNKIHNKKSRGKNCANEESDEPPRKRSKFRKPKD